MKAIRHISDNLHNRRRSKAYIKRELEVNAIYELEVNAIYELYFKLGIRFIWILSFIDGKFSVICVTCASQLSNFNTISFSILKKSHKFQIFSVARCRSICHSILKLPFANHAKIIMTFLQSLAYSTKIPYN